jgi:thioredoxin-like negative regulator of GroEL
MSKTNDNLLSEAKAFADEKRFTECADTFVKLFQENPSDPAALRELAGVMLTLGQSDSALALLADSVDSQKPDGATLHRIANLLSGLGRDEEAADFLLCALYQDPGNAELESEAHGVLGRVGRQADFDQFVQERAGSVSSEASAAKE